MGRVAGKVALVTGAAQGMGEAFARRLVAEGAKVLITDIRDDEGTALAAELGANARYLHHDVAVPDDWDTAVATVVQEFGSLNVLVNNAGIANGSPIEKFDIDQWNRILGINLTGTFLGIRAAVEPMKAAGGGSIINMSSIEGLRGTPWAHGYVAAKWAVRGLTKSAAVELATHGIRVNSVHPGLIRTPLTAKIPEDLINIPMKRAGQPVEVANFVLFLASDESSYATGAEFVCDGGTVADVPRKV
jgi:3alpha(or 20beta)-hydroxysteroid dehydrogenase